MKTVLYIYLLIFPMIVQAQNFFNQKKTKLKYIAQQIALLKVYTGYLKKGYGIAQDGLKAINDIKHGDFNLHNDYFNSLKKVNPAIKDHAQDDSIANIQGEILNVNDEIGRFIKSNDYIQEQEKSYIKKVMSNLLYECDKNISQFVALTTDSTLALKDDERLRRIGDLTLDMKDKYSFAKYFDNSVKTLAISRARDLNDAKTSELLYEIK